MAEGRVYVLDAETVVRAFDATTGQETWEVDLTPEDEDGEEGRGGGVAYEGGRIFVTTGFGETIALDTASGEVLWRTQAGTPYRSAPTANGGRVFTITSDNQMICISAADGEILWRHRGITESAGILAATSPAVSGSIVIAPYSSGELFALRVENGNQLWSDSLTRTGNVTSLTELNDIAGHRSSTEAVFTLSAILAEPFPSIFGLASGCGHAILPVCRPLGSLADLFSW